MQGNRRASALRPSGHTRPTYAFLKSRQTTELLPRAAPAGMSALRPQGRCRACALQTHRG